MPVSTEEVPDLATFHSHEDVVISGISCRLPESDNMQEFSDHLMNGDDMVTEDDRRWEPGMFGLPKRSGKLKDITRFDAAFFGISPKQANTMDPQLRILLEVTYEALVDSGVNPQAIRGSDTGVFVGVSGSEADVAWSSNPETLQGYCMTGCQRAMMANRLSFFFDFKGPSFTIDTACSSSLLALDQALAAIRSGACHAAIVGGSNLCLKPQTALQFMKLGMLSPEGACKSFDESGNGYCRSEGVVAIYIQKASKSKRIYATVLHSKTNADGNKDQGITFPSGATQRDLLHRVYREANISPSSVSYVEAHGTGTKVGDPQELNSIAEVFCEGRDNPLLIGSVKSNMGHPEPASGLCAVAKVILAMENRQLPGNLHYKEPNPDVPGLTDSRLKVVSETQKWNGGLVGVNSFGFGGANVHAILKSNDKAAISTHTAATEPRALTFSARTERGLEDMFERVQQSSSNIELHSLLHENAFSSPQTHPYRGYMLVNTETKHQEIKKCLHEKRPVWYIFSGMGTQWHGMGRDLMKIKAFETSILKSDSLLKPFGVNLFDMLMNGIEEDLDNSINSFVSIAAIQVAIVDILRSLGLEPDGMVGHSVGELGCGYADGTLTAEQTVLAAYWRGKCIVHAHLEPGGMAAVGLTWDEARHECPPGVVPACHNAKGTVTISGPKDSVHSFVEQLKQRGVFAKEVESAGVAFHSYYMVKIAPKLKAALDKVIIDPKPRSSRWISSSIPEGRWDSGVAEYSSSEYHVNNLVSPVLFQEALEHVPNNAITVEIAPHCLLQAILKRSLGSGCEFVSFMKRNHPNNLEYCLSNLGKLYACGVDVDTMKLYPPVKYPVSRGTPLISPLLSWDHSQTWDVPTAQDFLSMTGRSGKQNCFTFTVDTSPDSDDHYLLGHKIDGRVLFPATGYMVLAWQAVAMSRGQIYDQMPISLREVYINRATILPNSGAVQFEVTLMLTTGRFEISEHGGLVASGSYSTGEPNIQSELLEEETDDVDDDEFAFLDGKEVYRELRLRGYEYEKDFHGISLAHKSGNRGKLVWRGNWVSFLDTMLQMCVLRSESRCLHLPTRIQNIHIDPNKMTTVGSDDLEKGELIDYNANPYSNTSTAAGIQIVGLHTSAAPKRQNQQTAPTLEEVHFVPYTAHNLAQENKALQNYVRTLQCYLVQQLNNADMSEKGVAAISNHLQKVTEGFTPVECDAKFDEMFRESLVDNASFALRYLHGYFSDKELVDDSEEYPAGVYSDKALGYLLKCGSLKAFMDIAVENTTSSKLKLVEIGSNRGLMYNAVLPELLNEPMINIEYLATDKVDVTLQGAYRDDEERSVKTAVWNLSDPAPTSIANAHVVLVNNALSCNGAIQQLQALKQVTQEGGFILLHQTTKNHNLAHVLRAIHSQENGMNNEIEECFDGIKWRNSIQQVGLEIVAEHSDGLFSSLFLCRSKKRANKDDVVRLNIDEPSYSWVSDLQQRLKEAEKTICLTSSCSHCGIVGMVNCLRKEAGGHKIRCTLTSGNTQNADEQRQLQKDLVMNIYRDGQWGSFRHKPSKTVSNRTLVTTDSAYVNMLSRGDMSTLRWIESHLKHQTLPADNKELCEVHYASLNFRDIMLATGKLSPDAIPGDFNRDCMLGMEFSGMDSHGTRVMGLVPASGLATKVVVNPDFLWEIPESWTFEQAASIPVVYTTVYYALVVRGHIRKGDSVLIHSGSGGVGQAAIAVALSYGCEVYTTVGNTQKKDYLLKRFPHLRENHIFNSRNASFEKNILKSTKGKGVNIILNSLAEEKLQASVRLLAQHGRFLEIGKFDLSQNNPLGMAVFLRNVTFHGILLDALFDGDNPDWLEVKGLLERGIESGVVQPLKTTVFGRDEIEPAFRYMSQGRHIGKVMIEVKSARESVYFPAIARTHCSPRKTYIITGGLGGFGLELANWLVERGAMNLVLTSRSGLSNGYQARHIRRWRNKGVQVVVSCRNISSASETKLLIDEAASLHPVGGIFHLAMVLRDGLFENQSPEAFQTVCDSKVTGTLNLNEATRLLCPNMDWFVVFSSVSCGRGNAGQSNYGFANSVMERICEQRQADGLQGLAIQWGAIGDVGVILENIGSNDTVIGGTLPQRMISCLETLDTFLNQSHPVVSSYVLAAKTSNNKSGRPKLVDAVARILGVKDGDSLNPDSTLADLGLDSLMGVEVKQTVERYLDSSLSIQDIRQLTMTKLNEMDNDNSFSENNTVSSQDMKTEIVSKRYSLKQMVPEECIVILREPDSGVQNGERPLFIVHPIEGSTVCLSELSNQLHTKVYGIQHTSDAPNTSIEDLARYYIEKMKSMQGTGPYQLAGYSFGGCVVFEMATQLQSLHPDDSDIVQSLILLDSSHSFVSAHTQQHKDRFNSDHPEGEGQGKAICAFIQQFLAIDLKETMECLLKLNNLEERALYAAERLLQLNHFTSKDDVCMAAKQYYYRLYMADQYHTETKYNGDLTLFRTNGLEHIIGGDYGLAKVCSGDVTVHIMQGTHDNFLLNSSGIQVADIMNKLLVT